MDTGNPDDLKVWVPFTTAQRWFSRGEGVHKAVFIPRLRDRSPESIRHVRQVTALHHRFDANIEPALWFFDSGQALAPINAGIGALRLFVAAAGAITLLVGAVGVMNIMLIVASENATAPTATLLCNPRRHGCGTRLHSQTGYVEGQSAKNTILRMRCIFRELRLVA